MKVSVIIPFYSNINWLEEAVDSVLTQTYKDLEIIVINDGSPENDTVFLNKYGSLISYFKIKNGGPAKARNYGIDKADGEYIAFLDSDDLWMPEKIEIQLDNMLRHDAVWSHTNYSTFNENGLLKEVDLGYYDGEIFPMSLYSMHVATPSVIIKKSVLQNQDFRFQEKMRFGQDYYLWLTLSKTYPILLVNQSLCRVRIRGTNAALRARAHLQVRAQIWDLLKNTEIFKLRKNKTLTKVAYSWCAFGLKQILYLEKMGWSKKSVESTAKFFYAPSFIIFQLMFNKYKKK